MELPPVDGAMVPRPPRYQQDRRPFTTEELEVAWAASLWLPLHNARAEVLMDKPPIALTALREQAAERLRRAGA